MTRGFAAWLESIWRSCEPVSDDAVPGWRRIGGELVFVEDKALTQEEWLHPLNLIRDELGRSGNVEHMPSIDTWNVETRAVLVAGRTPPALEPEARNGRGE